MNLSNVIVSAQVLVGSPPAPVQARGLPGNQPFTFTAPTPLILGALSLDGRILVTNPPAAWLLLFQAGPTIDPTGTGHFLPGQSLTLQQASSTLLSLTSYIPNGGVFLQFISGLQYTITPAGFPSGTTWGFSIASDRVGTGPTAVPDPPSSSGWLPP